MDLVYSHAVDICDRWKILSGEGDDRIGLFYVGRNYFMKNWEKSEYLGNI